MAMHQHMLWLLFAHSVIWFICWMCGSKVWMDARERTFDEKNCSPLLRSKHFCSYRGMAQHTRFQIEFAVWSPVVFETQANESTANFFLLISTRRCLLLRSSIDIRLLHLWHWLFPRLSAIEMCELFPPKSCSNRANFSIVFRLNSRQL